MIEIECVNCGKKVKKHSYRLRISKTLYCSRKCKQEGHRGYKHTEEAKRKIGIASIGRKAAKGSERSTEFKRNLSEYAKTNSNLKKFIKGDSPWNKGTKGLMPSGENHSWWIEDRTQLKKSEKKHLDVQYRIWMFGVKKRDNWKCKIKKNTCLGRLEAHHILNWVDYPEARYKINNGITLCHAHHPRGRAKEKRLVPKLQELMSVSSL